MFWNSRLKKALDVNLGDQLVYMPGWKTIYTDRWRGPQHRPVALLLHHTAGAATESTFPSAKGNQKGANAGVIAYVQSHYRVPAANFTLDRDGTVYVHAANPVWHAGLGSFRGKSPWNTLAIPENEGNSFMLGVEIVSRGTKKDFTKAQKVSLKALQEACGEAAKWPVEKRLSKVRRPRHKDWTTRKIDILYSQEEVDAWMGI
jgi:hypothetical protein